MDEKQFVDGLTFKEPSEKAPEWIKGQLGIHVQRLIAWLEAHDTNNGWIDVDIKVGKSGKYYTELNTFKPNKPEVAQEGKETPPPVEYPKEDIDTSSIPF